MVPPPNASVPRSGGVGFDRIKTFHFGGGQVLAWSNIFVLRTLRRRCRFAYDA
jgi:hypothetical protein